MIVHPVLRLLRPHHWIKNAFLFVPLFFSPALVSAASITHVILGFLCFCLAASSIYIFNDARDYQADQLHATKKNRPVASGAVTPHAAYMLAALCGAISIIAGFFIQPLFACIVILYIALNIIYCLWLKHQSLLDVLCIAASFVLRVVAGSVLIASTPSPWIFIMTGLVALFLAFGKRRDDLVNDLDGQHRGSLNGYNLIFVDTANGFILGALLVAYLIYTTDAAVMARYNSQNLYVTAPFVMLGILRYLQIILVENRSGSPTKIMLTDRLMIISMAAWLASMAVFLYG